MENKYDIFISYSRHDLEKVKEAMAEIEQSTTARCWMDLDGIESGEQFKKVIISAINHSDTMLFMLSNSSMRSEWALDELDFAKMKGKRLVIVHLENVSMIDDFYFTYHKYDQIEWNKKPQREKLIRDIRNWIGKRVPHRDVIIDKQKEKTIIEIVEGVKNYAEKKEHMEQILSPIDKEYMEYGYTIVGCGKSTISKEDVDEIKDDLSFIKISESVIAIEKEAFNYSPSQLIVIPDSVKTIGKDAFNYVPNIVYHGTAQGMPWGAFHVNVFIEDDFIYADKNKKEITGYIGDASLVTIPKKVETIGALSFYYCHYIKTIVIPNSVTRICESAFDGCVNLQEVKCSDSLKHIDWAAFRQCKSLKSIVIPKSIRDIGECAFYGCDNLKTVYLGNPNANYSKNDCPSFPEHTQIIKT